MKLELIVIHHNEDWRVGKKFFDILAMQRDVDLNDILVTIIQSGPRQLSWDNILRRYPYTIRVIKADEDKNDSDGLAAARNTGINHAVCEWMMFCDFDDTFADLYAMRSILSLIPNNTHDILWMKYYNETPYYNSDKIFVGIVKETLHDIHGKLFRTSFLKDSHFRFFPQLSNREMPDAFLNIAITCTTNDRFGHIATEFIPYIHTYRKDNLTSESVAVNAFHQIFIRDLAISNDILTRTVDDRTGRIARDYLNAITRLYVDMYIILHCSEGKKDLKLCELFKYIHATDGKLFYGVRPEDVEVAMQSAEAEFVNLIQDQYRYYGRKIPLNEPRMTIYDWLTEIEKGMDNPPRRIIPREQKPRNTQTAPAMFVKTVKRPHVAVYAGTRNVYADMVTSAKSLVAHNHVDRVYFLIEDDVFPEPLPPYVHTINVSGYKGTFKDSPNAGNVWTYMAMTRGDYTTILPEPYVLSLDVDTIIQDDITELFELDLGDNYIAGVNEQNRADRDGAPYINFGVVCMNLAKMRKDAIDFRVMDLLQHTKLGFPEQDAYNRVCRGHILTLPTEFNVCRYTHVTGESDRERISHYAGIAYYRTFEHVKKYAEMEWKDLERGKDGNGNEREWNE